MREGWTYKAIGEIAEVTDFVANGSFASLRENVKYLNEPNYAILVRLADYSSNFDSSKFVYVDQKSYKFLAKSSLQGGEIIMSNVGSLGKLFICPDLNQPMTLGPNTIVIKTDYNKFFYYLFSSEFFQNELKSISSQTALPKFNKTSFKKLQVPVPPKSQQEVIVSELDEINSLLTLKREQLQKYDKLAQSLFYEMFGDPVENEKGWEVKKFIDVVKLQRGFDLPTNLRVSSGNIPVYGSNGVLGFHNESKIDSGIITGRSGTIGEVFVSHTPCWPLNTSLFSVDTHGNNLVYLQYLLRAYDLKRFVEGAGVPTLNRNVFHNNLIIDCPLPLQQQFASRIEQIESQKQQVQAAIEKLETLLASRMQYWFE